MSKNYLFIITPISLIFIVLILLFSQCNSSSKNKFDNLVRNSAIDGLITKKEIIEINNFISNNSDEFDISLINDSLALKEMTKVISKKTDIKIDWIEKVVVPELNKIRIYIETSSSMMGYMRGGTSFQDVVNDIIGELSGTYNIINIVPNTVVTTITPYNDQTDFISRLSHNHLPCGGHSPLDDIFQLIIDSSQINDINVFISDGIMSGTDNQIRGNRDYNIENRILFKNRMRTIFNEKRSEYSVAVYAFTSDFNCQPGNNNPSYFDYQNSRINLQFTQRPFYVFIFGNNKLLPGVIKSLELDKDFQYKKKLFFGINDKCDDKQLFASHIERHGNCITKPNSFIVECKKAPTESKPVSFAVAINLSDFPTYCTNSEYLINNFSIVSSNSLNNTKILNISEINSDLLSKTHHLERTNLLNSTHYINIEVPEMLLKEDTINIVLNYVIDNWYNDWSIDDDRNIGANNKKTFNFKYLIDGIDEAYNDENKKLLTIRIPIKIL